MAGLSLPFLFVGGEMILPHPLLDFCLSRVLHFSTILLYTIVGNLSLFFSFFFFSFLARESKETLSSFSPSLSPSLVRGAFIALGEWWGGGASRPFFFPSSTLPHELSQSVLSFFAWVSESALFFFWAMLRQIGLFAACSYYIYVFVSVAEMLTQIFPPTDYIWSGGCLAVWLAGSLAGWLYVCMYV